MLDPAGNIPLPEKLREKASDAALLLEAVTPKACKLVSPFTAAASPAAMLTRLSPDRTVYETASEPPDNSGLLVVRVSTSPVVLLPPIAIATLPLAFVPKVIVSVAPPLSDSVYVVPEVAIEVCYNQVCIELYERVCSKAARLLCNEFACSLGGNQSARVLKVLLWRQGASLID